MNEADKCMGFLQYRQNTHLTCQNRPRCGHEQLRIKNVTGTRLFRRQAPALSDARYQSGSDEYMFAGNSSEGRIWPISPSDLEISPPSSRFRGVRPGCNVTVCRKNCLSTGTRCSGFHDV